MSLNILLKKINNMKKILWFFVSFVLLSSIITPSFALTPIANKWVKIFTNKKVDTTPPTRFKPSESEDIKYRLSVLPNQKDANYSEYMVIPAMWLVSPIVKTPKTITKMTKTKVNGKTVSKNAQVANPDYIKAIAGKAVDFNKYFSQWVHQYPGTPDVGTKWNTVLGGHSNYYMSKRTNYTTIFGRLPELDKNDQVRFYKKQSDGKRMLLKYKTVKSYETKANDVNVILPINKWTSEVTLYTCVPIGTAKERRIVKAEIFEAKLFG